MCLCTDRGDPLSTKSLFVLFFCYYCLSGEAKETRHGASSAVLSVGEDKHSTESTSCRGSKFPAGMRPDALAPKAICFQDREGAKEITAATRAARQRDPPKTTTQLSARGTQPDAELTRLCSPSDLLRKHNQSTTSKAAIVAKPGDFQARGRCWEASFASLAQISSRSPHAVCSRFTSLCHFPIRHTTGHKDGSHRTSFSVERKWLTSNMNSTARVIPMLLILAATEIPQTTQPHDCWRRAVSTRAEGFPSLASPHNSAPSKDNHVPARLVGHEHRVGSCRAAAHSASRLSSAFILPSAPLPQPNPFLLPPCSNSLPVLQTFLDSDGAHITFPPTFQTPDCFNCSPDNQRHNPMLSAALESQFPV